MPASVNLNDIVEALEMLSDEHPSFLDLETGKVVTVSSELLRQADGREDDEPPDLPEWQKPEWKTAMLVHDYFFVRIKKLPTKYDVHEWEIMREFADSKPDPIRADLLDAIHGRGAFRIFKNVLHRHGLKDDWFDFRAQALRQIAIDFCEEVGVAWK
jgi:hypothetical protein